jgi:glycosyltransferase involved in cell wall biosynthesis
MNEIEDTFYKNISVIIPCFRCHDTIERAVSSVVNQSLQVLEIILVEDCSNDQSKTLNTLKKIKKRYEEKIIIIIIENKLNRGPGFSRNVAWDYSSGNFIAFLDSDDAWHFRKLEIQIDHLRNNPQVVAVCNFDKYNLDYRCEEYEIEKKAKILSVDYNHMLFKNYISTRSVLIKKSVESRFNSNLWYSEDYWLWLDILNKGGRISRLPFFLSGFYKETNSNLGLSSHLFNFFIAEFNVIKSQQTLSFKSSIIKTSALLFCAIKFVKRMFYYGLINFKK